MGVQQLYPALRGDAKVRHNGFSQVTSAKPDLVPHPRSPQPSRLLWGVGLRTLFAAHPLGANNRTTGKTGKDPTQVGALVFLH